MGEQITPDLRKCYGKSIQKNHGFADEQITQKGDPRLRFRIVLGGSVQMGLGKGPSFVPVALCRDGRPNTRGLW